MSSMMPTLRFDHPIDGKEQQHQHWEHDHQREFVADLDISDESHERLLQKASC